MRTSHPVFSCAFALALVLASQAVADTITLKSGEKVQGKVLQETDTQLTVEIKTASITDTQTISKADVAKIDKEMPDEAAYLPLKALKLGANSMPLERYEASMRPLQAFVNQFPQSPHVVEANQQLAALNDEKSRVEGGEIKLAGKWISKDEVQKERYQLGAQVASGQMQDLARRGDLVGALNTFDQLEKSYPGANAFPDALMLAKQILPQLKALAERALQTWQVQRKEREANTKLASEPTRSQLLARQTADQKQLEAAFEAAIKAGQKWPPLQPQNEKGLTTLAGKVPTELQRLEALPVAKMRQSIQLAEKGRSALASQDLATAEDSFKQALAQWNVNEVAIRLQKETATALLTKSKATPAPVVAAATPVPATPAPLVAATPVPEASPAAAVAVSDEPRPGFFRSPLGLGLLVVILLGAGAGYMAYKKKKQQANDEFEEP